VTEQPPELGVVVSPSEGPLALADALAGVRLGNADIAVVTWVRRQSAARIAAVVAVLEKVRQAGYTEGYGDARGDLAPEKPRPGRPFPDPFENA
jgi:hypothetical protein